jgi:queuosine precursor transporter
MNNLIFLLHTLLITLITLIASKLGERFISSTIVIFGILANLFVLKQIDLFSLHVTSADVFIVGISLGLNLIQDQFDQKTAQKTIWLSFWGLLVYTILSEFQIWYLPNSLDSSHVHFVNLLSIAPRLTIASLISYLISQTIDVKLYAYLKNQSFTRFNFIKNYSSIAVSQLADTIIFSVIGLSGLNYNLFHIILFSYLIKLSAILISVLTLAGLIKI